jgi:hypothetical protein
MSIKSALYPVVRVMVDVGSGPSVLVTAWYTRSASGERQAIHVMVLRRMRVERFIS